MEPSTKGLDESDDLVEIDKHVKPPWGSSREDGSSGVVVGGLDGAVRSFLRYFNIVDLEGLTAQAAELFWMLAYFRLAATLLLNAPRTWPFFMRFIRTVVGGPLRLTPWKLAIGSGRYLFC